MQNRFAAPWMLALKTEQGYKIAIIAPTCFYYQAPLFREISNHPDIDLTVYFCSDEALHAQDVQKTYRSDLTWGMESELLEGYDYKFVKNYSPVASYLRWPFGLINLGIWKEIKTQRPDVVVLMSWMNPTWWLAILACKRFGIRFVYMTDANAQAEMSKKKWVVWLKKVLLGKIIFTFASGFLCSGSSNKLLYSFYKVPDHKLFPFAYSWGYQGMIDAAEDLTPNKKQIRSELGIPEEDFVILYCGRLSPEKDPVNLLKAFNLVKAPHKRLALVGDGILRQEMEDYVAEHNIESVSFFGFQNRNDVVKFYAASDMLVLPSLQETWGIVINEALCFGLPIVCSDRVGASYDLVLQSYNGFKFPAGDCGALAEAIQQVVDMPQQERRDLGSRSTELIRNWSRRKLGEVLTQHLDVICSRDTA